MIDRDTADRIHHEKIMAGYQEILDNLRSTEAKADELSREVRARREEASRGPPTSIRVLRWVLGVTIPAGFGTLLYIGGEWSAVLQGAAVAAGLLTLVYLLVAAIHGEWRP